MPIDRRSFLAGALAASALTAAGLMPDAAAKAPVAVRQVPGLYRLKVGGFQVTAVNDGMLGLDLGLYPEAERPEAERLVEAAFLAAGRIPTAVNAYLVNTGDSLVLIDTGTATAMGPTLGRLAENLGAAGVDPAAVDVVLITHLHPDHASGLLAAGGSAGFPNAQVLVAEAEHGFWTDDGVLARTPADSKPFFEAARAAVAPYAARGRLQRFAPGREVVPGITALAAPGHTPGHAMFRVASGNDALLVWGDVVHTAALQFPHPEWAISFDVDRAAAIETRRRVFDMAATERMRVAGMHLPFPGIGHVTRTGAGYAYAPVFWSPEL